MILVTGGTGLLGAHLLYKLLEQEVNVRAIYRDAVKFTTVKKVFSYYTANVGELFDKIEWVRADITDVPALEIAFKEVDFVYHCAADVSFNFKNYKQSQEVNVVGTANIVNLCLAYNVKKLCHVSSIATLGENFNEPITETTRWNPENNKQNIYAITKYNAELEVWRGTQEGLSVVIVNPGIIFGPGYWKSGTGELFTKVSKGFSFYTSGTVGVVGVNDVVTAMIRLINAECVNEQYVLVSENKSYKELIRIIANGVNNVKQLKEIKRWHLLVYLQIDILKSLIFGTNRSLYKANINSAFKELNYSSEKVEKAIDINFEPIANVLKQTSKLFRQSQ